MENQSWYVRHGKTAITVLIAAVLLLFFIGCREEDNNTAISTITDSVDASTDGTNDSHVATLSSLALSDGALMPTFSSDITTYGSSQSLNTTSINVMPVATDSGATISVNNNTVSSGTASEPIRLNLGANDITILVTAADDSTTQTYTVSVERGFQAESYIKAPNAESDDRFGYAVAISGDTLVVGAYHEDSSQTTISNGTTASSDNSEERSGAVYVFVRSGTSWSQQAYLKASNASETAAVSKVEYFGESVAISGDAIVVGAHYEDSKKPWLVYGPSALSDNSGRDSGAVYLFLRDGVTWRQGAYRKAPNVNLYDYFGFSVTISGDTIIAGAYGEDSNQTIVTNGPTASEDNSASESGAIYVFH